MNNINFCKSIKIKIAFFTFFLISLFSCSDYLDVNKNLNNLNESAGAFLLPSIELSIASQIGGELALKGSLWAQFYNQNNTSNQYRAIINMDIKESESNRLWNELYAGALNDIKSLKKYSSDNQTKNEKLYFIASVLEAYTFQVIFDVFEYAPYDEALKGEAEVFNPKYEYGKDVYPKIISNLQSSINKFSTYSAEAKDKAADALIAENKKLDYLFEGDMNKWKKFANSLLLKLAMRQLDVYEDASLEIVKNLITANMLLDEDAKLDVFEAQKGKENPLFAQDQNLNTKINLVANKTIVDFLNANSDPREALINEKNKKGNNVLGHGDYRATTATNPVNSNRKPILKADRPVYFLTTSELDFFRAELAVNGHTAEDAKSLYEKAVKSAFVRIGSKVDAATKLLSSNYSFSTSREDKIKDIGAQKWISLCDVNPYEALLEIHRLDYPTITYTTNYPETQPTGNKEAKLYKAVSTVIGDKYITRYLFPSNEKNSNANYPSDKVKRSYEKLWWDIK